MQAPKMNIQFKICKYYETIYTTKIISDLIFPPGDYSNIKILENHIKEYSLINLPDLYFMLLIWVPNKKQSYKEFDEVCWAWANDLERPHNSIMLNSSNKDDFLKNSTEINSCFSYVMENFVNYLDSNFKEQLKKAKDIKHNYDYLNQILLNENLEKKLLKKIIKKNINSY